MRESEDLKARLEKAIDNVPIEWTASGLFADAHTTIERLEAEVEMLRAALREIRLGEKVPRWIDEILNRALAHAEEGGDE